jgi:uncharacterized membrane protein
MELLMVRFEDEESARTALEALERAVEAQDVDVSDFALVHRAPDGKVHVEQHRHVGAGRGAVRGAVLGAALGIVTGGVGAVAAAGATGGALFGGQRNRVDPKVMKRIGQVIEGSEAVVFVAAEVDSVDRISTYIDERRRSDVGYVVLSAADEDALKAALE